MTITKSWAMIIAVYVFSAALGSIITLSGIELDDAKINFAGQLIFTLTGSTSAAGAFVGGMKHRNSISSIAKESKRVIEEARTDIEKLKESSEL